MAAQMISGPMFLGLYVLLLVVAAIVSAIVPKAMRPQGRVVDRPDPDAVAWLAGGSTRFYDSVVARYLAAGDLLMSGPGKFATPDGRQLGWRDVTRDHAAAANALERRLRGEGLVMRPDELPRVKLWAALPFLLVGGVGIVRLLLGVAAGRPVGFLSMLLAVTAVIALSRWKGVDRRTAGGIETLARARGSHDRLRRAPMQPEMGMAVALFGTTVLAGSAYAAFHQFRAPSGGDGSSSSDGGSSDGGSSCGSSCGGGGCGG